ncbi:MAG: PIG-L family deacetylase [Ignisphaera sp.]|nr:PIG-L family deacetylase [Ignisphaera sp.]MCX8167748.1 PIG-L family deacetylase [Ignisphaera sp.]MDW8086220.1 PIG-L deacetylase family protein [Ignisphaera sp.]
MPQELSKYIEELLKLPEEEAINTLVKRIIYPDFSMAFEKARRILCVAPHPDDCEVGAGGTIALLSRMGKEVSIVIATDGSLGTSDPNLPPQKLAFIRMAEQEEAAKIMGVRKVVWLGYKDGYMPYDKEARAKLVEVIRVLKPDILLSPDPWLSYEAHPDHRNTGLLTADAIMASGNPHYVEEGALIGLEPWRVRYVAFYYTSKPNYYYNITDTMDVKMMALKAHKSQFEANWNEFEMMMRFIAALYGKRTGVKYAEAFKLLPLQLLHAIPFTEII